jgi:hypothetical protein
MKKILLFILIICLIMMSFIGVSFAQTISGRLNTSIYSWQQRNLEDESAQHMRTYQLAQFSIGNIGLQGLSFHTYLNLSHDLGKQAVDDPRIWLYNCYFDYKTLKNTLAIGVGRQRIYAGVGYGTIDGVRLKYRFKDYFNVKFYAGMLAPLQKSTELADFDADNLSWGFHITSTKIKKVRIGISYAAHSRTVLPYKTAGVYSGNYRLEHPISTLQKELIGIDLKGLLSSKFRLNARLDYNFGNHTVRRGQGGVRWVVNKNFDLGLDYIYRTPYLDLNSIFSVFTYNPNQEIALLSNYLWRDFRFNVNLATVMFEGDNNLRLGFGCSWKQIYMGYFHRSGYGGDNNGLSAHYKHILNKKLHLTFGSNLASYKLYSTADDVEFLFGGTLGVLYFPVKKLSLQLETQLLNNKIFDHDFRIFFRGNYAFFHRF